MSEKLDNVMRLYLEGIKEGRAEEAVQKYTGARYTQHSTGVADGADGFLKFFLPFLERNPVREIEIVRAIEDGKYVQVHAHQSLNNGEAKWVTIDLFETDENSKIVEHWDTIAPLIENSRTAVTAVDGSSEIVDLERGEENKKVVRLFLADIMQNQNFTKLSDYIDLDSYIEHNQEVEGSLGKFLKSKKDYSYDFTFKVLGQGNFVYSFSKALEGNVEFAVFDIFRLENTKIVEHWDNREKIIQRSEWNNSGKF